MKHKHNWKIICWLRNEHQNFIVNGEELIYYPINLLQCSKCKTLKVNNLKK